MGLFRDNNGIIVEADDAFARAHSYTPVTPEEEAGTIDDAAQQQRADDRGIVGSANATLTGAASSLSLGGTDMLLAGVLSGSQRERLQGDIEANPGYRMAGEFGGALVGGLATGGALGATPAGYLGQVAGRGIEAGLAKGGVAGTAEALGAMATEGALQNAGQYLGAAALADKEVTVEGFAGALGTGGAFGAAGGGVALGVTRGTIAARKLYSKYMDGGKDAVVDAESAWSRQSQELLEADEQMMGLAKQRLDDILAAKAEAGAARQRTDIRVAEEKVYKAEATANPRATPEPYNGINPRDLEQHGPMREQVSFPRQEVNFPREEVRFPREEVDFPREEFGPHETHGPVEGYGPSEAAAYRMETDPVVKARLEAEAKAGAAKPTLADDVQARIDGPAPKKGARRDVSKMSDSENLPIDVRDQIKLQKNIGGWLSEVPKAAGDEVLGVKLAKQERDLTEALEELEVAKTGMLDHVFNSAALGASRPRTPKVPRGFGDLSETGLAMSASKKAAYEADEAAYNAARENARAAFDDADTMAKWDRVADDLEAKLTKQLPDADKVDNIVEMVGHISRYEKASAKLADVMEDAAHPVSRAAADELAKASDDAVRKVSDRQTRALEDAETFGPYEEVGPVEASPKERVKYAKDRQLDAKLDYTKKVAEEAEAKKAFDEAKKTYDARAAEKKLVEKAEKPTAKSGKDAGKLSMLVNAGAANEILDIPGMPKASDLPVIGPLLGAYLKYRGAKAVMNRFAGRVPATADAKAAAYAAKTRDRIAKSVDRSLGLLDKGAKVAAKTLPQVAGVVSHRIFDDGEPDAPKGSNLQQTVAVRVRELGVYVTTPNAIEHDVRKAMKDVTDPDLILAAEKWRRMAYIHLLENAPKIPEKMPLDRTKWLPAPGEASKFARRLAVVADPASVFEEIEHQRTMITLEAAQTLRKVYPQMFALAQQRMLQRSAEVQQNIPYARKVQMTLLYDIPLDASMQPDNMKILQDAYKRIPAQPPAMPGQPPMPSVAGETNMTALFQTSADRRASR